MEWWNGGIVERWAGDSLLNELAAKCVVLGLYLLISKGFSTRLKASTFITETAQVRVDSDLVDSTSWRPFTCSGCTPCMHVQNNSCSALCMPCSRENINPRIDYSEYIRYLTFEHILAA